MCGLCGVYGQIGYKEKEALAHLSIFSQLRGLDSTGYIITSKEKKVKPSVVKELGGLEALVFNNQDMFDFKDFEVKANNLSSIICHHRKATIGDITIDNAHPFEFSNIIGMHNGTIHPWKMRDFKSYHLDKSDSNILLEEINNNLDDIPSLFKYIDGAWALVWWNKRYKTISMLRNDKRPLILALANEGKTLFWASERWMINVALTRAGVSKFEEIDLTELTEDEIAIWSIKKDGTLEVNSGGKVEFGKSKHVYNYSPRNVFLFGNVDKEKEGEYEEQYAKFFGGGWIHKRLWLYKTSCGCWSCKEDITWKDRYSICWIDDESPLCPTCTQQWSGALQ